MCSPEEYNDSVVPTTHKSQLLRPKADPHLQEAGERVQATAEELERLVAWGAGNEKHSGRHLSAEIAARPRERAFCSRLKRRVPHQPEPVYPNIWVIGVQIPEKLR
jgi:hypothetical protein